MPKQHKNWERLSELYMKTAADVFVKSNLTQEDFDFLQEVTDSISNSSLKTILSGEYFSGAEEFKEETKHDYANNEECVDSFTFI